MMFQGRSVISAVWGVVPGAGISPDSNQPPSLPVWARLRLFRRHPQRQPQQDALPRLPIPSPDPSTGPKTH